LPAWGLARTLEWQNQASAVGAAPARRGRLRRQGGQTVDYEELGAWLRLTLTPGLGPVSLRRLLAAFGSPEAVLAQDPAALRTVVNVRQAEALGADPAPAPNDWRELLARSWAWMTSVDAPEPRAIVALGEPGYPAALLQMEDPPLLLHLMGRLEGLHEGRLWTGPLAERRCLAIVGSRNPTPQGALNARQFASSLAGSGLVVVSGLALGVDGEAHEGALSAAAATQGPVTVAVVGTGLDQVYPRRHAALARRIAARGLIVSEQPLGTPPLAENFPRRNRLIAGLCCATLVVEAAPQSGSLITARLAAELGKEVMAMPGSIHNPQSKGCHALIRQGAKLVESAQDVLEELPAWAGPSAGAAGAAGLSGLNGVSGLSGVNSPIDENGGNGGKVARENGVAAGLGPGSAAGLGVDAAADVAMDTDADEGSPEHALRAALGTDPVSLDALQARTGWPTAQLQARLMALELAGEVARLPGGLLQRLARS
jgi:DNA processing protein